MNMTMKVVAAAAIALMASGLASATQVCVGSEGTTALKDVAAAALFIKSGFKLACSKNVDLHYDENIDAAWVAAGSMKGVTVYGGTTEGGGGSIALFKAAAGEYLVTGDVSGSLDAAKTRTPR